MKIVIVEWVDSFFYAGWHDKDSMKSQEPSRCVTAGVLLKETSDKMVLCLSLSQCNVADIISIPKRCVKRTRQLKIERR